MPEQEYLSPRQPGGSQGPGPDGEDPLPWANPSPARPARPGSPGDGPAGQEPPPGQEPPAGAQRTRGSRAARAVARRRRRWLFMLAGLVGVAGAAIAVVLLAAGGPGPAPVVPGALITTFQPGELQQVPDACRSVPGAIVQQYLPGQVKVTSPLSVDGAAGSSCDWSIDHAPVYRLGQLSMLAYAPSGLATGNGSATYAAIDAYDSALAGLQNPPPHSAQPRATITMLSGLGNEAFSAQQVFRGGGAVTYVATVVVRYHNVLVTATVNGLEQSNRGHFGPVSMSQLSSACMALAQAAEATLH